MTQASGSNRSKSKAQGAESATGGQKRALLRRARHLTKEAGRLVRRHRRRISADAAETLLTEAHALRELGAAPEKDWERLDELTSRLDDHLDEYLARERKSVTREYIESILWAVGIALFIRAFFFEAFQIPTGSMIPTLQVGDHIFVNKFIYGLRIPFTHIRFLDFRTPDRGEIVVFEYPGPGPDHGKDFIKRVVALAGDRVRMRDHVLYVNGAPVFTHPGPTALTPTTCGDNVAPYCECLVQYERLGDIGYVTQHHAAPCSSYPDWPLAHADCGSMMPTDCVYFGAKADNPSWPEVVVPDGTVFCMGDNRDNSHDGRYWGAVPLENVKGRAFVIWWASDLTRLFQLVH